MTPARARRGRRLDRVSRSLRHGRFAGALHRRPVGLPAGLTHARPARPGRSVARGSGVATAARGRGGRPGGPACPHQHGARPSGWRTAPEFVYVNNGAQERMQADAEFLFAHRYLLSPGVTAERFSVAGLRAALEEDLALLASPAGTLLGRVLPRDPTGELLHLLDLLQPERRTAEARGRLVQRGGRARAADCAHARGRLRHRWAGTRCATAARAVLAGAPQAQAAPAARLLVSGPGVFAVASRAAIKRDVTRISWLAVVLVSALLLAVYRSPRLLLLILLPVVTGATAGVAAVSLAFGSVHGITLGFGATLLGEGVDYAIYLFSGGAAGSPTGPAATRLWRTLRLGRGDVGVRLRRAAAVGLSRAWPSSGCSPSPACWWPSRSPAWCCRSCCPPDTGRNRSPGWGACCSRWRGR